MRNLWFGFGFAIILLEASSTIKNTSNFYRRLGVRACRWESCLTHSRLCQHRRLTGLSTTAKLPHAGGASKWEGKILHPGENLQDVFNHVICSVFHKLYYCTAYYWKYLEITTSPWSCFQFLMLNFWQNVHFLTSTSWCPKHTIMSSAACTWSCTVLIRAFSFTSYISEIRAEGIQKMTAQGNCFFINVLFSQVYSRVRAMLQSRRTHQH